MVFQIEDSAWTIIGILTAAVCVFGVGLFVAFVKNLIRGPGVISSRTFP
jgi:hypothetical protein